MKIISADERLRERARRQGPDSRTDRRRQDVACCARSIRSNTYSSTLRAGDLSVLSLPVADHSTVDDWPTARDLACRIGGPNKSFPPTAATRRHISKRSVAFLEDLERIDIFSSTVCRR